MIKKSFSVRLFTIAALSLGSLTAIAQPADPGVQYLQAVASKGVSEKLYVHTDKAAYMAGEILWFKVYNVDAPLHRPLDLSKVAYVDILDRSNTPVAQAKIDLEGNGNGSIHLPLSLASGNYKLRGYTSWMKNAGPDTYFEQVVTIINPLKNLEGGDEAPAASYIAAFFPEGGNLVQGLESRLAFKLTDKAGRGMDGSGVIVNSAGDTVTTFASHKFGIGSFTLRPQEGQTYKALVTLSGGEQFAQELPRAAAKGYTMTVEEEKGGSLKIVVLCNEPAQERNLVYLLTHTRGITKGNEKAMVSNGAALFYVNKTNLGDGVSQFTLFNNEGQPVCERLYFKRPSNSLSLTARSDKEQYSTRDQVSLAIQSAAKSGSGAPADLSLSVYRLDSLQQHAGTDIQSYLWLTSDLRGVVESPEYYLGASTPEVDKATDLLMLSHGWRRLNWKEALAKRTVPPYPLEFHGHLISARIVNARTGAPAPGVTAFLSVPGTHFRFHAASSDSSGIVRFDVKDLYGATELAVQTYTNGENQYRFEVLSPFSNRFSADSLPPFKLAAPAELLEGHSIAMQAQNVYRADSLRRFAVPFIDTLPFYGKGHYSYALDEYTRFTTMEEVLREYVTQINVVLRGGKLYMRMLDEDRRQFNEDNVLVLLDGIPLPDKNKIFEYDPRKVRQLDVISKGYLLGSNYFKGVASFMTYSGNLEGFTLDPRVLMVNYEGLQLHREFFSPVYATSGQKNSRIPDFRTTLLWKPDITIDEKGASAINFYTSDKKGQYIGVLQGIDKEGRPASATFAFSVK